MRLNYLIEEMMEPINKQVEVKSKNGMPEKKVLSLHSRPCEILERYSNNVL